MNPHVWIESITPEVDGGRYPVKGVAGDLMRVEADIVRDGHELLLAVLEWRKPRQRRATEAPMTLFDNDRWAGELPLLEPGWLEYTVLAWTDVYGTWLEDLRKRVAADEPVRSELTEGVQLLQRVEALAKGREKARVSRAVTTLQTHLEEGTIALEAAADAALVETVRRLLPRDDAVRYEPALRCWVDRPRAVFGAWYEFFPRSQGPKPGQHGTFSSAAEQLPRIRELGFDVVYLPPISPVGVAYRKGRNNSLTAEPGEPGSPWAIGAAAGGHDAIEPALGTLEDFRGFVAVAEDLGLEVALDFAIQASPDHPWVQEHPDWFHHRPDGTIKYAENPPKKYQDVYPFNFDTKDWKAMWAAWRDVLLFWVRNGVRIFRVDNPHTKAFPFWQWVIAEVQEKHPDVLFLAEAFTRPKVMKALAKLGFTQSYTYFTWRNDKEGLTEYLTELHSPPESWFIRPNLFTNTPDILNEYLVNGGRPAFLVRLILAATLSPTYGIYSGYELCENVPVKEGSEEYLNSEKYELAFRDFDEPGNINDAIRLVNRIRRDHPVFQHLGNLQFLETDNPQVLAYARTASVHSPPGSTLLVLVNLDPHATRECTVSVPPELATTAPSHSNGVYSVHDLWGGDRYTWSAHNFVRLTPEYLPAHILKLD